MNQTPPIFASIPRTDKLSLFDGKTPKGQEIVALLDLTRSDVAKAARVSVTSVRYDIKMPEILEQWLREVATTVNMVAEFFGDREKTVLWFMTPNPMLGSIAPIDMIKMGRVRKLLHFVQTSLEDNQQPKP